MASKTRNELRTLVRVQLDMDVIELPDGVIDPWLEDGFERSLAVESRWPFFEYTWNFTTVAAQVAYSKATIQAADASTFGIDQISSVLDITTSTNPTELKGISHDTAEDLFGIGAGGSGVPAYWSEWANSIHLWQAPSVGRSMRVRGFRKPLWAAGTAVVPDCDARLHLGLYFFAAAQAYMQQEDEVLSASYMKMWQDATERAHDNIMAAPQRRPNVMSGGGS